RGGGEECREAGGTWRPAVGADPRPRRVVPHRRDLSGPADDLRQRNRIGKAAEAALGQKAGDRDFARLAPQFMPMLDLGEPLELPKRRIRVAAAGHDRQIEDTTPDWPIASLPFDRCVVV